MYGNSREYSIQPHCPWYEAQQSYGPPNVKWCEKTQCSWVNEPANAYSNAGYLIAGVLIMAKLSQGKDRLLKELGLMIFLMGLGSFVYHSTNNFFTQFFDFLGMFLMTSIVMGVFSKRIRGENIRSHYSYSWMFLFLNTFMFWVFHFNQIPIQFTVVVNTVVLISMEVWGRVKEDKSPKLTHFLGAIISLAVAQVFSGLDLKRTWCEPENLILHGHAIWHLIGAVGMVFLGFYIRELIKVKEQK